MNVLVVGAHPDDELLGVGGTIIRHIKNGDKVYVYLMTDGHTSRYRDTSRAGELSPEVVQRVQSAKNAAKLLGIAEVAFGPFQDQRLDAVPFIEVVHELEAYTRKVKPEVVYAHHKGDVNKDHQVTFDACLTAFRSVGQEYPLRFLTYETLSSSEWGSPTADTYFMPNVFINITEYLDKKIEALEQYSQEMREFPHPRSLEGVRVAARRWGSVIGVPAAEAFFMVREVLR